MYGKGSLLNAFIGKARLLVATNYSLTGKKNDIKERVAWLLTKTQFVYGDIDFKVRSFHVVAHMSVLTLLLGDVCGEVQDLGQRHDQGASPSCYLWPWS